MVAETDSHKLVELQKAVSLWLTSMQNYTEPQYGKGMLRAALEASQVPSSAACCLVMLQTAVRCCVEVTLHDYTSNQYGKGLLETALGASLAVVPPGWQD